MKPTRRVAVHEAGHVIAGIHAGAPGRLLIASVVPDREQGTLGHVRRSRLISPQQSARPTSFRRAGLADAAARLGTLL